MYVCGRVNKKRKFILKKVSNIKYKNFKILKQIGITQLLSIVFAIVGELHIQLLIRNDWLFTNIKLLGLQIILLIILYAILINLFLEGKCINILLIFISYIVYLMIVSNKSAMFFPINTNKNDYGVGIIGLFTEGCQCISVLVASIIGTCLRKIRTEIKKIDI